MILLLVAVGIGAVIRLALVARAPLMHPDGPAYLGLAEQVRLGNLTRVFGGYYSPLYPAVIAAFGTIGVPAELAGRLAATAAGLAAVPLLWVVARRLVSADAAIAAVMVAAVHPALVKSAADVIPETLAGALLLAWLAALLGERALLAGALAGATYLARPEGVLLVPLGLAWLLIRRARRRDAAAFAAAAIVIMAPAVLALHARSGMWQLSPREARIATTLGMPEERTFLHAVVDHPVAFGLGMARGTLRQLAYDAKALSPLLWPAFVAGLTRGVSTMTSWPLVVVAAFTALPLALNPSPRYAVPLVPLLLPSVGSGLFALGRRFASWAPAAAAVLAVGLVTQALWESRPFDAACSREVSRTIVERYGTGQTLVAVDGRFAYGAHGRALVPRTKKPDDALALARRYGARLWITRPAWVRAWQPPPGAREVARPCRGTFILYELDGS